MVLHVLFARAGLMGPESGVPLTASARQYRAWRRAPAEPGQTFSLALAGLSLSKVSLALPFATLVSLLDSAVALFIRVQDGW